jgi:hypothetical protein
MSETSSIDATPKEVFMAFLQAIENRDGETSWNYLSKSSQELFGAMFALMDGFADAFTDAAEDTLGVTKPADDPGPFPGMEDGKTMWVKLITEGKEEEKPGFNIKDATVKSEEVGEDEAHLIIAGSDGEEQPVDLVMEDGAWRLQLAQPGAEQ